jgi:RNA polymerase sigma-70 factor (ECF subfamily)
MTAHQRAMASDAIAILLAKHGLELARHLRRLVRDDEVAADLLQDTFLRAHGALGGLRPGSNERAWLYRIATNAALNHLRSRAREAAALARHARDVDVAAPTWLDGDEPDGGTRETDPRHAAVWARVAGLPERQKVALTLRVSGECDYDEIAKRMGGTEASARANVHQAIKRLRKELR